MTTPTVSLDIYGVSVTGKVRTANEDHFLVASLRKSMQVRQTNLDRVDSLAQLAETEAHLLVVADGVGGVAGGSLASGTAIEALSEYIGRAMDCYYQFDPEQEHEFIDRLEQAVQRAHEAVLREYSPKGRGPATTVTMVTLIWPRAYVVHVGDSRGYQLRGGTLRQFTQDQTMGDLLVEAGAMSEAEARRSGMDNVLASAVGGEMTPATGLLDLHAGESVLLCSDGLTKHMGDDAIRDALMHGDSAESTCHALVDAAMADGGSDNITVILARANA